MDRKAMASPESTRTVTPEAAERTRVRYRRRRVLIGLVLVVGLAAGIGPRIAANWIEDTVVAHFAREQLTVDIEELSVGWLGSLNVSGFAVRDGDEVLARCGRIEGQVALGSLLGSEPRASVKLIGSTFLGERTVDGFKLPLFERLERIGRVADAMDDRTTHSWQVRFEFVDTAVVMSAGGEVEASLRATVTGQLDGIPEFSQFLEGEVASTESRSHLRAEGTVLYPHALNAIGIEFDVEGMVRAGDPRHVLSGFSGHGSVEVPIVKVAGLQVSGPIRFELSEGKLMGHADFVANNGVVSARVDVDMRTESEARSKVDLDFDRIAFDFEAAHLLRHVHPVFTLARPAVDAGIGGELEGNVKGDLEVVHDGPLDLAGFVGGWAAFPKNKLSGRGHLEVHDFTVDGSAMLDHVLEWLDVEEPKSLELDPIDFTLSGGRLSYDGPVMLKIDEVVTYWRGSIGLDQTIDLVWELPITTAMIEKEPALRLVPGGKIDLPVSGTFERPSLDLPGALTKLVAKHASGGLEELGRGLIGDWLGGNAQEKAKALLGEADRLYDAGERDAAGELYAQIRAQYRDTLTYKLNKRRIKVRGRR